MEQSRQGDPDAARLRALAEARVPEPADRGEDSPRLLHELRVHQVELEMQNLALKEAQEETQAALDQAFRANEQLEERVAMRTRQLEEALVQSEAANQAKSAFLATMSHELRTPLNAIRGMTELALRRSRDEAQKAYFRKTLSAAEHLTAVIGDILDMSRIEADRVTLAQVDFSWQEVLRKAVDLVAPGAEAKGLTLCVDLDRGLQGVMFVGDPLRLGQVLLNLLANAVKFTERGTILVRVRQFDVTAGGARVRCEVHDDGIGIGATDLAKLFKPFQQVDSSSTRKHGGAGLGLVISKRLVELMGGEMGVDSVPGRGSEFWFSLGLRRASSSERPAGPTQVEDPEAQLKARHRGARILLAEDDDVNQELAQALLEDSGMEVDVASDGQQAVDLARAGRYAAILMDMRMPRLGGVDATREIRRMAAHQHTPVIALTANAFGSDRQACLAAGMNDFLTKPYSPPALFSVLLTWLDRGARASAAGG